MEQKKIYHCSISGEIIPEARVEFLLESGIDPRYWTVAKHSTVQRKKGIYMGEKHSEDGVEEAGELKIVDRVYDDSVQSILRKETKDDSVDSEEENED